MATGTVKWFNDAKGFGFIRPDDDEASDVFAHFSAIAMDGFRTLKQGARVSFELQQGPKGQLAQNIQVLSEPAVPQGIRGDTPSHAHHAGPTPPQERDARPFRTSRVRAPQYQTHSHGACR